MTRQTVQLQHRRLELSNLGKVLYPETGFTKGHVLDYYRRIAPCLIPHLRNRPLTLKRYPNGVHAQYFYEKRCPAHRPKWIATAPLAHEPGKTIPYCSITDLPSLMWVANLASLELHVLLCRAVAPERPIAVAFDLDPGPPGGVLEAARLALLLRQVLDGIGLQSFANVSGKKGIHLYVPVNTPVTFDQTKHFARTVARELEKFHPDLVTSRMSKSLRPGKVLIDWSQNDSHKTTVSPYSLRATDRPNVAAPVDWPEIQAALDANDPARLAFLPDQVVQYLETKGDLFEPLLTLRQYLPGIHPVEITEPPIWQSDRPAATTPGPLEDTLAEYRKKRDFAKTTEPAAAQQSPERMRRAHDQAHAPEPAEDLFVIHKHAARALHYDFRLRIGHALVSWAVPKGPSLNPKDKRLAVRTEDHPLDYASFEGRIPKGQYGAGQVIIWDQGRFHSDSDPQKALDKGHLEIWLEGQKLRGGFHLVRSGLDKYGKEQWLLFKKDDDAADPLADPVRREPWSVVTGLWNEDYRPIQFK